MERALQLYRDGVGSLGVLVQAHLQGLISFDRVRFYNADALARDPYRGEGLT